MKSLEQKREREYRIPWGAWSETEGLKAFRFPECWIVDILPFVGFRKDTGPDLVGLERDVRKVVRSGDKVTIALEDLTRPSRLGPVLEALISGLIRGGAREDDVELLFAVGAHAQVAVDDIPNKVGQLIADRFPIRSHDCQGPHLAETGLLVGETPLWVDRGFLESDLRIGVGSVMPNAFAGFSGGGKIVLPGISSFDVLIWLHKLGMMGFAGGVGKVSGNRIREEIDRVSCDLPLHFSVSCLADEKRIVREIHWGHPVSSHRRAIRRAREVYHTPMDGPYDILFCNAFPKDAEYLQLENAYSPLRTGGADRLKAKGGVVVMGACYQGRGHHGLFDRNGPLHRPPARKAWLGDRQVFLFCPGVIEEDVRVTHWDGYHFFPEWDDLIRALVKEYGPNPAVGIYPNASCQLGPAVQS